jgi:endonuclease III
MVENHNLSVKVILETPEETLNTWINKVGFHNKKAKYIKAATS